MFGITRNRPALKANPLTARLGENTLEVVSQIQHEHGDSPRFEIEAHIIGSHGRVIAAATTAQVVEHFPQLAAYLKWEGFPVNPDPDRHVHDAMHKLSYYGASEAKGFYYGELPGDTNTPISRIDEAWLLARLPRLTGHFYAQMRALFGARAWDAYIAKAR